MRTNRALALALLSGLLTACGQTGGVGGVETSRPTGAGDTGGTEGAGGSFHTQTTLGDVRMLMRRSIAPGDTLVVEYELHNAGAEPILVHDRVPPTLGSALLPERLDPERAWIFMVDSRIRVSKQGFDAAPGVRFIAQPVTGARVLEPGQRLSGRARIAFPVELDVPGPEFEAPRSPIDANATEFDFCVQVTEGSQGRPSGVDPTVLEVPSAAPGADELICSQPLGLVAE